MDGVIGDPFFAIFCALYPMEMRIFSTNGLVDPKDPLEHEQIPISVGNNSERHSCSLDITLEKRRIRKTIRGKKSIKWCC